MASKTGLTTQKVVNYIKEKWQVFGVSALIIFILQLLSTRVIISALLGLVIAALLPSDTIKKVTKKITKEENGKN